MDISSYRSTVCIRTMKDGLVRVISTMELASHAITMVEKDLETSIARKPEIRVVIVHQRSVKIIRYATAFGMGPMVAHLALQRL
jgi:hypothetical protein